MASASERAAPRAAYSFASVFSVLAFEWATASMVLFTIVAPRGAVAWLGGWLVVTLILLARERRGAGASRLGAAAPSIGEQIRCFARGSLGGVWFALAALIALGTLSTIWSPAPGAAAAKMVNVAGLALGVGAAALVLSMTSLEARWFACRGVVHAVVLGFTYIAIEHATGGAIKAAVTNTTGLIDANVAYNREVDGVVTGAHGVFLNRHTTAAVLLLPAALAAARVWRPGAQVMPTALLIAAAVVALASYSESALMALSLGVLMMCVARLSASTARRLWLAAWLATIALVPFVAAQLPGREALPANWPRTVTERIAIWRATSVRIPDAPLLGHGVEAARSLNQPQGRAGPSIGLGRHAHNGYLQVWFDLGAVGALLLAGLGAAGIGAAARMPPARQVFVLGSLATMAGVFATAYGLWQLWLLAVYGLGLLLHKLASGAGSPQKQVCGETVQTATAAHDATEARS
ncbi:MAG: O-antigen ligase family protein [Pseudomonadota bacterium]